MSLTPTHRLEQHRLADHSADGRMLLLAAMALVVGTGGACGAWVLLKMIEFATNLFWFGRLSAEPVEITDAALGIGTAIVPVIGSLIVGLMARRSEEHTSELQSLMRISYAVFCLKKNQQPQTLISNNTSSNNHTREITTT